MFQHPLPVADLNGRWFNDDTPAKTLGERYHRKNPRFGNRPF